MVLFINEVSSDIKALQGWKPFTKMKGFHSIAESRVAEFGQTYVVKRSGTIQVINSGFAIGDSETILNTAIAGYT